MTTLLEKIGDLNDLVLKGKALEAFDKYYHAKRTFTKLMTYAK